MEGHRRPAFCSAPHQRVQPRRPHHLCIAGPEHRPQVRPARNTLSGQPTSWSMGGRVRASLCLYLHTACLSPYTRWCQHCRQAARPRGLCSCLRRPPLAEGAKCGLLVKPLGGQSAQPDTNFCMLSCQQSPVPPRDHRVPKRSHWRLLSPLSTLSILSEEGPRAHQSWLMPPLGRWGGRTMMPYGSRCAGTAVSGPTEMLTWCQPTP